MSDVEIEEIFSLQQKTKVRIHAEKIVIENPAGKFSLWNKKPIVIPFEFLLAVEVGSSDAIEVRSKNTRKVFDIQVYNWKKRISSISYLLINFIDFISADERKHRGPVKRFVYS